MSKNASKHIFLLDLECTWSAPGLTWTEPGLLSSPGTWILPGLDFTWTPPRLPGCYLDPTWSLPDLGGECKVLDKARGILVDL